MMNDNVSYNTILDLLVGDSTSVEELKIVLNFINRIGSVINHLLLAQKIKLANKSNNKFNGDN